MERSKIEGDDLRGRYGNGTKLGNVFRDIEDLLKAESRVVCQYIVNGMALEEKDEGRFSGVDVSEVQSLEYLSERTEILLDEVIDGWLKALPGLQSGADALARRLQAGDTRGTVKSLHDLVENCEFLVSSLFSTRSLLGDAGAPLMAEFDRIESATRAALRNAVGRLVAQDFVQLALVIEYDLNHGLEEWTILLKGLQAHRRAGDGDHGGTSSHPLDRRRGTQ